MKSFFLVPLVLAAGAALAAPSEPVRLAVSVFAPNSLNEPIIEATIRAIGEAVGPENLAVERLGVSDIQSSAATGRFSLMLSSAGNYRRLAILGTGAKDLATVASDRFPNPNFADGSVFFTRADRGEIRTLADLRGKTVSANHALAFSGWQTALAEIFRQGWDPDKFFGRVIFKGHNMHLVVDAVESGEADAGIVRNCFLEDNGKAGSGLFKVINSQGSSGGCAASTALYPNWTISTFPSTSPETSRAVARALLAMPSVERGLHWALATDFTPVDRMFLDLRLGPYEYLREFSAKRFISEHRLWFVSALLFLGALILHSLTVGHLVKRRTRELEEAASREIRLTEESREAALRIEEMQRAGVVGQMSSIIAHELRQPLGSIGAYSFGLLRRMENGTATQGALKAGLERIGEQARRASAIIEEVRSYARGKAGRGPVDLSAAAKASVKNIEKTERFAESGAAIRLAAPSPVIVEAKALEMELVAVNLLRNALDAVKGREGGLVEVRVSLRGNDALLEVSDNGPPVDDEVWKSLAGDAMRTTKAEGLGLGLPIVRMIAANHGGELAFEKRPGGGLTARVALPSLAGDKNERKDPGEGG